VGVSVVEGRVPQLRLDHWSASHLGLLRQLNYLHAFPSVDKPSSNAVCCKAGLTLSGAREFEYPPGHPIRCNDWPFDLTLPS
jgi:hypothetical protein